MADRWTALVRYRADDTTAEETFTGARISSQLFADGRAMIVVRDAAGDQIQVWQCRDAITIDKTRQT